MYMEQNPASTSDDIVEITAAPSYRRRIAQEKLRQQEDIQQAMWQYYAEHPNLEADKKQASVRALGLYVIQGEKQ